MATARFPLISRMIRTVRVAYDYHVLKDFDYWPRPAIEKRKNAAIKNLIDFAYAYVPYYQEIMRHRGLQPSDFQTANDLRQLPIISKDDIVETTFWEASIKGFCSAFG